MSSDTISSSPRSTSRRSNFSMVDYCLTGSSLSPIIDTFRRILDSQSKKEADDYVIKELNKFLIFHTGSKSTEAIFASSYDAVLKTVKTETVTKKFLKDLLTIRVPKHNIKPSKKDAVDPTEEMPYDLFNVWLTSGTKRTWVDDFVFDPSLKPGVVDVKFPDGDKRWLNAWKGFQLDGVFENMPEEEQRESLEEYEHIKSEYILRIICNRDMKRFAWLMNWISCIIQHPEVKTGKIPVLVGPQGSGKTFFIQRIAEMFGSMGVVCPKGSSLADKFSGHLFENKVFVGLDETRFETDAAMDILKSYVTNTEFITEKKFCHPEYKRNFLNFMLSSNDECCLHFNSMGRERRVAFFEVSGKAKCNKEWFANLLERFEKAKPAMFFDFKTNENCDITLLDNIPHSDIMEIQKSGTMNTVESFFSDCVNEERNIPVPEDDQGAIAIPGITDPHKNSWRVVVNLQALHQRYLTLTPESKRVNLRVFILMLKTLFHKMSDFVMDEAEPQEKHLYNFPSYSQAREILSEMMGKPPKRKQLSLSQGDETSNGNKRQKKTVTKVLTGNASMDFFIQKTLQS